MTYTCTHVAKYLVRTLCCGVRKVGNKHSALRYTMHTSVWFICMGEGGREGGRERGRDFKNLVRGG